MNKTKIGITLLLFVIGFIITDEIYMLYVQSYEDMYHVSFYLTEEQTAEELTTDIEQTASKYHLRVFGSIVETSSIRNCDINIYGDESIKKDLERNYFLEEGLHKSILSGEANVTYHPFENLDRETITKNPNCFCLVGDYDNMVSFKRELIDEYGGSFPKCDDCGAYQDMREIFLLLWGCIGLLLLLFYYFVLALQKKELFVRITLGERLRDLVGKNILKDVGIVFGLLLVTMGVNYVISNTLFLVKEELAILGIIIIGIILMYGSLFTMNVSEVMSNKILSRENVIINYFIKGITLIACICFIAVNVSTISQWVEFDKQRDLFEEYKGYHYISVFHDSEDCEHDQLENGAKQESFIETKIYEKFLEEGNITYADVVEDENLIYANCNYASYLKKQIPEIGNLKSDTVYIIIQEGTKLEEEEKENYFDMAQYDIGNVEYKKEVLYYQSDVKLTTLSTYSNMESLRLENPIILLNNVHNVKFPDEVSQYSGQVGRLYKSFMNITSTQADEVLKQYAPCKGYKCLVTDVWEEYEEINIMLKRIAVISTILIIISVVLLIFMNQMMIRMLYVGYGIELTVKKIMGYSIAERFWMMFSLDIIMGMLSIVMAAVICSMKDYGNIIEILVAGGALVVINIIMVVVYCKKQDKEQVAKILKGGLR